jgi:hypothetical protein
LAAELVEKAAAAFARRTAARRLDCVRLERNMGLCSDVSRWAWCGAMVE